MDLNKRLDRLEQKLDDLRESLSKHLEEMATSKADITWLKGFVKVQVTLLLAVIGYLIQQVLN